MNSYMLKLSLCLTHIRVRLISVVPEFLPVSFKVVNCPSSRHDLILLLKLERRERRNYKPHNFVLICAEIIREDAVISNNRVLCSQSEINEMQN